jgi:molybdopterin molybdotransferase
MLLARLPDGRLYFGLPGNPVAALVAFRFFVVQAARALLGLRPETGEPIDAQLAGRADVTLFLRARRSVDASGEIVVDASLDQRSHILRSVLEADLWIRVDERDGSTVARAFPKAATLD